MRAALAGAGVIALAGGASEAAHAAEAEYAGAAGARVTFDLPTGFVTAAQGIVGDYERVAALPGQAAECRMGLTVRGAAVTHAPRRAGRYLLVPKPRSFVHRGRLRVASAGRRGGVRFYLPPASRLPVSRTVVDGMPGESSWQGIATLRTPRGIGARRRARTSVVVAHLRAAAYAVQRAPDGSTATAPASSAALAACTGIVRADGPTAVRTVLASVAIE